MNKFLCDFQWFIMWFSVADYVISISLFMCPRIRWLNFQKLFTLASTLFSIEKTYLLFFSEHLQSYFNSKAKILFQDTLQLKPVPTSSLIHCWFVYNIFFYFAWQIWQN